MRPGLHKSAAQTSFIARYPSKYLARKFCNNLETRRAPQPDYIETVPARLFQLCAVITWRKAFAVKTRYCRV